MLQKYSDYLRAAFMHRYFIKTPWLVRRFFPSYTWRMPADGRAVYLTFDDGPHPEITPWVLDQLKKYGAEASFFCIGNNVERFPDVYRQVLTAGHAVGNHTFHHLNGWKTDDEKYLADVAAASKLISTNLFRPPYGRIRKRQAEGLSPLLGGDIKVIMWDVLSADFDRGFSPEDCYRHVVKNVGAGSVIVFHDSEKAWPNLSVALPRALEFLAANGYKCKKIEL